MQFFVTLIVDRLTRPPAELESAMTEFVEDELQAGRVVLSAGLGSHADGVRVAHSSSGVRQGEARSPVDGFAVVEAPSFKDAVDLASRILRLHLRYVPDWTGSCEVRPIVTHCLP